MSEKTFPIEECLEYDEFTDRVEFSRSQALPGNAYLAALPPKHWYRRQSRRACIPRQSLGTRKVLTGK